jgi:hypothetical protein
LRYKFSLTLTQSLLSPATSFPLLRKRFGGLRQTSEIFSISGRAEMRSGAYCELTDASVWQMLGIPSEAIASVSEAILGAAKICLRDTAQSSSRQAESVDDEISEPPFIGNGWSDALLREAKQELLR